MVVTVKPALFLRGRVQLPASKSYSIRAFIIAACGGHSTIVNPSHCDDAKVSAKVIGSLGALVRQTKKKPLEQWDVMAAQRKPQLSKINVRESGTVLRFLLPLLALRGARATVVGEGTLRGRPNRHLLETLRARGIDIRGRGAEESIPIHLNGGVLHPGKIAIDGSLSSQFISALMIIAPQLHGNTELFLQGDRLVSADYITMTCQVLEKSGIRIKRKGPRVYGIKGNQEFQGLKNFIVPSDYGLAAFLITAAALTRSDITLNGHLKDDLIQADGRIMGFLRSMGVRIRKTKRCIRIKGPSKLRGGDFSLKNCPDLVPIMAVLALFAKGRTRLRNIAHARAKESDRISDLRRELLKVGADIREKKDELIIVPQDKYKMSRLLDPHKDHRLAMAFCILGLKLGVRVKDIECTHKSYPDFIRDLRKLGVSIRKVS
ncbi:MAG TPA: 3-phosphoshikimate 1-carboxyvinyltransferase [Candidatus Omnitrophota bacterium]|nr:3-phosphoshikimate 1-carboxyvinyltransferase [Candidatus Omnitrophota bacterium]